MGIPRFYRYMSERYPLINQPISDVSLLPEFDAFYLDMNGIVHNCTHSDAADDTLNSLSLEAQLHGIFTYLDRLITHIIKLQAACVYCNRRRSASSQAQSTTFASFSGRFRTSRGHGKGETHAD
ncbi:unnamed protein product [Peronospora farinosa]|uniref:Xrn1 N-terminal domain-containing protein n=1 Tax=Peronospora farinosa TaxID=134698 RepID=A0ABN8CDH2_9STRA|nr:unnamed protein product [Peronospora farinosa]